MPHLTTVDLTDFRLIISPRSFRPHALQPTPAGRQPRPRPSRSGPFRGYRCGGGSLFPCRLSPGHDGRRQLCGPRDGIGRHAVAEGSGSPSDRPSSLCSPGRGPCRAASLLPHPDRELGTDTHRLAARRDESLEASNDGLEGKRAIVATVLGGLVRSRASASCHRSPVTSAAFKQSRTSLLLFNFLRSRLKVSLCLTWFDDQEGGAAHADAPVPVLPMPPALLREEKHRSGPARYGSTRVAAVVELANTVGLPCAT